MNPMRVFVPAVLAAIVFGAEKRTTVEPRDTGAAERESRLVLPPVVAAGDYDVFVSTGTRTGTPRIALPLENDDGQRRYRIGSIRID